jgi:signal peptidase II
LKKILIDYLFLFIIAGTAIALDQLTKYLVRVNLPVGDIFMPDFWLTPYVRIMHWHNSGAALGLFQNSNSVITILSFVVGIAIIYYFPQIPANDRILRLSMSLLLGGAVGNLLDRLHQGFVTDFISIWRFPVFNLADLSISTGVVIMALGMFWDEMRKKSIQETMPPPASEENPSQSDQNLVICPEESQSE